MRPSVDPNRLVTRLQKLEDATFGRGLPAFSASPHRISTIPCTIRPSWALVAAASVSEGKKINFSQVFAGQAVGIKEVHDDIWLVSFMKVVIDSRKENARPERRALL
jgi:hypothetical protein